MFARRLLTAGTGGTIVAPPALDAVYTLSSANQGIWNAAISPRAVQYGGNTYFAYLSGAGAVQVKVFDNANPPAGTAITLHTGFPDDLHYSPSLIVDAVTKKLLVFYSRHAASPIYLRISTSSLDTDPTLANGFATEVDLASQVGGVANRTYPTLLQLTSETDSPIYLFWRERSGSSNRLSFSTSTDAGSTWAARTLVYDSVGGDNDVYWGLASNGTDRWDAFIADGSSTTGELYHLYYTGGSYFTSGGTEYTDPLPLERADTTMALNNTSGAVLRIRGACWDGTAPAALVQQAIGTTDSRFVSVRWRSGAWQANTVATAGGIIGSNQIQSGAVMLPDDPDTVYVPVKIGGRFEMIRYTSSDDGATWDDEALTTGSAVDHWSPAAVYNAAAACEAMWLFGTYTNDSTWSAGIKGVAA